MVLSLGIRNALLNSDVNQGVAVMDCKKMKQMRLTVLDQNYVRNDWTFDFDGPGFNGFFEMLTNDMNRLGVELELVRNRDIVINVNSYADLLNVVKVSSPSDGHSNQCHNCGCGC